MADGIGDKGATPMTYRTGKEIAFWALMFVFAFVLMYGVVSAGVILTGGE